MQFVINNFQPDLGKWREKMKWLGKIKCDICGALKSESWYDARTMWGQWAFLCHTCFLENGMGLGVGFGQMYDGLTLEKIAG